MAKKKYTAEQMIQALQVTKGQITLAARHVGCSYTTMRRYVDEYPTVKAAMDEEIEKMGDAVELALYDEAVNKRNTAALIFLAKTKFQHRGYVESKNLKHSGDEQHPVTMQFVYPDDDD